MFLYNLFCYFLSLFYRVASKCLSFDVGDNDLALTKNGWVVGGGVDNGAGWAICEFAGIEE